MIEREAPGKGTEFEVTVESNLKENTLEAFLRNGTIAYEIKLLGEEEEDEEMDDISLVMYEEHPFRFALNLPKPIVDAWWGRYDTEDRRHVDPKYIQNDRFAIELAMEEAIFPRFAYLTVVTKR